MNLTWILIIIAYIIATHLIAKYIGTKRRIGYGKSVFWSVLFSPFVGFIVTIMSSRIDK